MENYNETAGTTNRSTLAATTTNGVYVSEIPSDAKYVLYDADFFNALKTLSDDEILYGIVDDDTVSIISEEYGIR